MSTELPIYDNKTLKAWANASELQNSYGKITRTLHSGIKYILLTGKSKNGKSRLLYSIAKDASVGYRLIFLKGKELSFSNNLIKPNAHSYLSLDEKICAYDFNLFIDFIIGSIKFNEKLIIAIDDADNLPIEKLTELFKINTNAIPENNNVQFFITGLPNFQKKLRALDCLTTQNFIHFSIDTLSNEAHHSTNATKEYDIKSNISSFAVEQTAPKGFFSTVITDLQVLAVLKRSSALTKKYVLEKISKNTLIHAIYFARHYFNYAQIKLLGSNLFSRQLFKNANDHNFISKPSIKKVIYNNRLTVSKYIERVLNIPVTISKIYNLKFDFPSKSVLELADKIEPIQKIDAAEKNLSGWNNYSVAIVLVISFVFFISYRMQPGNFKHEGSAEEPLAENEFIIDVSDNSVLIKKKQYNLKKYYDLEADSKINLNRNIVFNKETDNFDITLNNIVKNIISKTPVNNKISIDEVVRTSTDEPSIPSNQESELHKLLILAKRQFEAKQLTTPSGDNAYETYQFILFMNPTHETALEGIKQIHNRYVDWANYNLDNNNSTQAKYYFNKALEINPKNLAILRALEGLKKTENSLVGVTNPLLPSKGEPSEVHEILIQANEKMQHIEAGIVSNEREYKIYQDAQLAYENILNQYPNNEAAKAGLIKIKKYYLNWAELELQNNNYNTASFLNEKALSLLPNASDIKPHIANTSMIGYEDN